jgi:hypothetical protein
MTEVVIVEEEEPQTPTESAEEIAEAIVEAQEEAREELEQEAAIDAAQDASEIALQAVSEHEHAEYSRIDHSHPEYDYSERMSILESRVETLELGLQENTETEVEEIEQTPTETTTEPERKQRGFRRGRR